MPIPKDPAALEARLLDSIHECEGLALQVREANDLLRRAQNEVVALGQRVDQVLERMRS